MDLNSPHHGLVPPQTVPLPSMSREAPTSTSIPPTTPTLPSTPSLPPIQLFFDDNVERDRAHIVDVRDAKTFTPLPFALTQNVFIKKVEPILAITQPRW